MFTATPGATGPGVTERELHPQSGLRLMPFNVTITRNLAAIVATAPIGNADGSTMGDWPTSLRHQAVAWNPIMPFPATPTVTLFVGQHTAVFPATVQVQVRMRGRDQFGNAIEEITPWVTKVMTTTSQLFCLHMSKVFAVVDDCWVKTSNVSTVATSAASIGVIAVIDPAKSEAGVMGDVDWYSAVWAVMAGGPVNTNLDHCGTAPNWGLGTPMRVEPYGPSNPYASPEIMGCTATLLRQTTTPTVINVTARVPARGQLSVSGAAPTTGVALGRSTSGWQGCMHKLGFFSNDSWTTKVAGIDLGGSSLRASGIPAAWAQLGEDDIQLTMLLRTTVATMRGANPSKTYPNG